MANQVPPNPALVKNTLYIRDQKKNMALDVGK